LTNGPIHRVDRRVGEEEERYVYHSNGTNGYHDNHDTTTNGYPDIHDNTNGYHDSSSNGNYENGTSGYHSNTTTGYHDNDTSNSDDSFGHMVQGPHFRDNHIIFINGNGNDMPLPNGHHRRHGINGAHGLPVNGYGNHGNHGNHGNNGEDTDSGYLGGESVLDELVFQVESVLENGHVNTDDNIDDSPDTMEFLDDLPHRER